MMRNCISIARRSLLGVYRAGPLHQSSTYNILSATTFSRQSQGIHHNNVDKPFERSSQPKVVRQVSVNDPDLESSEDKSLWSEDDDDDQKRKTEDLTGFVADKAKQGTKSAVETAFNVGKTMAEGMEKSWGGIKETTEKIKDTVVGDTDEEEDRGVGGGDRAKVDKHVEDLRRKAGGYDRRSP